MRQKSFQLAMRITALSHLLIFSTTAFSNESYFTIGLTQSTASLEVPSYRDVLGDTIDIEGSTDLTLVRLGTGMEINPYFAIEGVLATGLAEEDLISGPSTDINNNTINYDVTLQTTLFAIGYAVAQFPVLSNVNVQARLGYGYVSYYSSLEYRTVAINDFIEGNDDGSGLAYGAGINYQNRHHGLSLYYDVLPSLEFEANNKVSTSGIGLIYQYSF